MHTYVYTYAHMQAHTYMHTYTHTHTYTHRDSLEKKEPVGEAVSATLQAVNEEIEASYEEEEDAAPQPVKRSASQLPEPPSGKCVSVYLCVNVLRTCRQKIMISGASATLW